MLGISRDTVRAQARFKEKYDLPFTLLSDPDRKVCDAYGVLKDKTMYGRKVKKIERSTFVINGDGIIETAYRGVNANGHVEQVLADLRTQRRTR